MPPETPADAFPTTPDTLTNDWLSHALGESVRGFRVELFGEGAGIIGQVTRVHLDWDGPMPSIIAKFASPVADNRAVAAIYDMYAREVHFYQRLAPQLDLRLPACFAGAYDAASERFILLLEDMTDYTIGDQVLGCSADGARKTVDAIAAMHASCWQPDAGLGLVSHNNAAQRDGMIAGFEAGWPVVLERFRDLIPTPLIERATRMRDATPALLDEMCQPPVCLTHGDVRLDNIFYSASDVCLIDWQSVCTSAPEQDLAYFITQSVPPDVIDAGELRQRYFDELASRGVAYDRATFDRRYAVSALYLLNYAVVIAGTLDLANERGSQLAATLVGGAMRSVAEMKLYELL